MLDGMMMQLPLLVKSIAEFGERHYPDVEIVSVTHDNPLHRYTYADAFKRSRQLANALRRLGCEQGDRIGTLAWNDFRHFETYYAVSCSGMVCHTINPRLPVEQIGAIINQAEDRFLLVAPDFLPLLEDLLSQCPTVRGVVVYSDEVHMPETGLSPVFCYETLIATETDTYPWPLLDENAASALCYTQGTTGTPRGVLYSHRSTVLHAYATALPDALKLSNRDCVLAVAPMSHANAWGIPYAAVITGAKLVFPGHKAADAEVLYSLLSWEGVTIATGGPTVWMRLMNYIEEKGEELDALKRLVIGGAACPPELMEFFHKTHGVNVRLAWGMTETSPLGLVNTPLKSIEALPETEQMRFRLKQGRAVFGIELKITDNENRGLPWDGQSAGLLKVRGPWVCSQYFGAGGEADPFHDPDGWLVTGDIATIDPQGYVQICARNGSNSQGDGPDA